MSQTSSIVFKSSQWNLLHLIPMKSQCLSHTFCEAWLRFQSYAPFSKLLYVHIEKVSQSSVIVFKSSAWFSLCFDIQTNFFPNSYLQFTSFWAVWKWIMGLPKQLKSRSFPGPLTPWNPDLGFTLDPLWALQPLAPSIIFRFATLSNFQPCV